ncbi:ATP-binding protein [Dongia sp.]|uniref:ATP-binding protein n=1 Tax=Dongia sp. TaxID=1977262 RepID=UPI0035B4259D
MSVSALKVTSHVARDLLQSAALFKTEQNVVWEYVSNGLQYIDPGTQPVVNVEVDAKAHKIVIEDNGRGMTAADLRRYFQMHGENTDRKAGRAGRGMFGTGKSAAFGIGTTLRLTTVRNGKRSKVELERKDIEAADDGDSIPVKVLEEEVPTREPNGTRIEIEGIYLKKLDIGAIVRHVERHIARWPNAGVVVNRQECNVVEPSYSSAKEFPTKGTPFEALLGDTKLIVKIAQAPLEPEWQGIAILSDTVWHSTSLAGCENKPFASHIFGEIDVERLSKDNSLIPAFDMSRSMQLNPKNELVAAIFAFIGPHIESVRREIEKADRERRRERDNQKLQQEASEIARIINQDFDAWHKQVQSTMAKVPGGKDKIEKAKAVAEIGEAIVKGDEFSAVATNEVTTTESEYVPDPEPNPSPNPDPTQVEPTPALERSAEETETKAKTRNKSRPSAGGGFHVDFRNMGADEPRAKYVHDERTIYINLDHPQIANAKSIGGIEDIAFRRLSYEVAFSEYAIALASELAAAEQYIDINDPIFDIRDTLNRISRSAAGLYKA